MAVTGDKAVYFNYLEDNKEIDKANDTFKLALMVDTFSFDPDKHKVWTAPAWATGTGYSAGDIVTPGNGYVYKITVGGTSGTEPSWPTTFGNTVTDDGGVEYECWSYDTSDEEITQEHGYSGPITLTNEAVSEDEDNNQSEFTCDDVTITASGGSIGPTGSATIFNDTHSEDPIAGHIDFGESYTIADGASFRIKSIKLQNVAIQGATV